MKQFLKDNDILMKEWNYDKNIDIDLNNLTLGSGIKVWWKCSKGHEWQARIADRVIGTKCPYCTNKKLLFGFNDLNSWCINNNLERLLNEWNYDKNDCTPKDVIYGSDKKVWWRCSENHEWQASIYNRIKGSNCIYCAGQKPVKGINDLTITNSELLEEWDYDKNGDLKPENFMAGSNISVWWKCELGHSWKTSIAHRSNGTGCPKCYLEYGTSFPEQAICYYLSKITEVENRKKLFEQEVDIYLPIYKIGFEYDGSFYHENEKSHIKEIKKNIILEDNGIKLYRIKESNKTLFDAKENIIYCETDRNYEYISNILNFIGKILNMSINDINIVEDRTKIYKQYVKFIKDNNFLLKHPDLIKEWDYDKNDGLSPEFFSEGSNKKVWWKCEKCKSSYSATISHKVEGTNCPYCNGKKVNETNNLKFKYPELSKYWDYEKNQETPEKIYFSSRKRVWWKCSKCNKSFEASICTRIKSKHLSCPECMHLIIGNENRKKSLKNGSLFDKRPDLIKEWNYEKNINIAPTDISCGSGIKVWWKCSKGHEWQAQVCNRTNGNNCPYCYKLRNKE